MTHRGMIRLGTFAAALALCLVGLLADARVGRGNTRAQLEYGYRRALGDLTDYVGGMRDALEKAPYAGGVAQTQLSMELIEQSGGAKAAISALPLSQEKAERLSRFLSQTGDYALYLSRRAASGAQPDESAPETLAMLEDYAGQLSGALQAAQARLDTEDLQLGRVRGLLDQVDELEDIPVLDDDLDEVAQAFGEFPTLLYDGPFSDHMDQRTALALEGEAEIAQESAAEKAAAYLRCRPEELVFQNEGGKTLAAYSFSRGDEQVSISKAGGFVTYYKKDGLTQAANLGHDEALAVAQEALRDLDIYEVMETYNLLNDNLCTLHFAGREYLGGRPVVCYPDLVKVTVELEQGGTVEVDATGWWMNRHERDLEPPAVSAEEAKRGLSPLLAVEAETLSLIPSPGGEELLCWEFLCTGGDRKFLVYVNCKTGIEEQLFLLREDEHGTLVS